MPESNSAAAAVAFFMKVLKCDSEQLDKFVELVRDADMNHLRDLLLEEHEREWREFYSLFPDRRPPDFQELDP